MKRILLVVKGLGLGGTERLIASAARSSDGSLFVYEVAYLLPHKDALVPDLEDADIKVHLLGSGPSWIRRLRALTDDRKVDLVHLHSPVLAGARVALPRRLPIVYTEHNVWARYRPATRWANAVTYGRNRHVFAVSDQVLASIRSSWLGRRCRSIETLHHGLAAGFERQWERGGDVRGELGIAGGSPLVVSVANFKPFKGHEHLLRAAAIVRRDAPDVRFVLVGVGPGEPEMRRLADDLGLNGSVVFAGFRDDAPRLTASADVFVLPSEHEGLPIALLEAMALGRAVVATDVDGIPEAVRDGVDAVLVGPRDPDALASAIVSLLEDPALRERLGASARARAARFDMRDAVRRMEEVYEELLS